MTEQWYVLCTKPNQEKIAWQNLIQQRYIAYLPMYQTAGKKINQPISKPLFPSYVFVKVDIQNSALANPLYSTNGVSTVLCLGDRPQSIPADIIQEIKDREVNGWVKLKPRYLTKFQNGDAVKVRGSPLDAIFDEVVDRDRAALFISLLGQQKRIVVPITRLSAPGAVAVR